MADKPINWPNILLHVAVAFPMAAGAGAGLQLGLAYGGVAGAVLIGLSAAAGLATALYWIAREKLQHHRQWGGLQSNLEWAAPVTVTPIGMALGWFLSAAFL